MKKLFACALVLALVCVCAAADELTPASEPPEGFNAIGVWDFIYAEANGTAISKEMLGTELTVAFHDDGTYDMNSGDVIDSCTWEYSENGVTLNSEGEVIEMTFDGENLNVESNGVKLVLERRADDASEGITDVSGKWQLSACDFGGITVSSDDMGISAVLTLNADGTGSLDAGENVSEFTWMFENNALTTQDGTGASTVFAVEGTQLTFADDDVKMYFDKAE